MNFPRILAHAFARRIAFVIVAAVVAFVASCFVPQKAHAQSGVPGAQCLSSNFAVNQCDQGFAYTDCVTQAEQKMATNPSWTSYTCTHEPTVPNPRYVCLTFSSSGASQSCSIGGVGSSNLHYYLGALTCQNKPDQHYSLNTTLIPDAPGSYCDQGCKYSTEAGLCTPVTEGDAPGWFCHYTATPTGSTCTESDKPEDDPEAPPEECTAGQVRLPDGSCGDQGDCPVGQHSVGGECHPTGSCETGQVKGPDGSCNDEGCPAGQAKGDDGSCKPDGDGDGQPDEGEDDGTFSGGDNCQVPPTCSGDNIMCGLVRINWRIDCNTRKNRTITGGNGCGPGSVPICTGEKCDALEYSQLLQTYHTKCAVEAANDGDGEPGEGGEGTYDPEGHGSGIVEGIAGTGDPDGAFTDGSEGGGGDGELDTGGFGYGSSCPALPTITVYDRTIDLQGLAGAQMCDWFTLGGNIIMVLSALMCLRILASAGNV